MDFMYAVEGEIRLPQLAITQLNQHVFSSHGKKCVVNIGAYIRVGDEIIEGMQTPYSGQVIHINTAYVIIRRVYPYAMSHGSSLFVNHGDLIQKNTPFGTLVSLESTAGDIVQGLPKVDELLEAREPVEKILSSVHAQLAMLFLLYSKAYGMQEGCRRSLQKIRRILVNEVQAVYSSQGVFISDKHIEIIVRQMTTYVMVVDPGETNLLPGDIVDLRRVEHLVDKSGMAPVQYRPILLGITRASLAAESFIAAASFQETKRVLTRAAVEGHIDWLTGLKENVILGRLIPAGTGLYV
jgi:DNA-directed RNA polymerase subunit beta'